MPVRWTRTAHQAFLGRRRELEALEQAWSAARDGARQVVFLGGEPGAGKSRLLAEVASALHAQSAGVLLGTCVPEFGMPYQPMVEPVETMLGLLEDGAEGSVTARLLDRLAIVAGRGASTGAQVPAEREHRRELYDAVAQACCALAERGPLVLALEDLHWAGPAGLQLLSHVVERTADARLLVLATHRTTAPDRSDQLVHAIAQLYRLDGVRRLDLPGLDTEDITDFLVEQAGVPAARARTSATVLRDQTGGNPFFLRELWRDLLARGGLRVLQAADPQAPASVRDTIQNRLDRLTEPERQTLELAAVMGGDVEVAALLTVSTWSQDTTLAALDTGVDTGLLEPVHGPGQSAFRFLHALARQAVLDLVPPSRRAVEHARVGEAMERAEPRSARQVQQLAHHFANAHGRGCEAKAIRYLVEAAGQADRSLAHEEAATLLTRAMGLSGDAEQAEELRLSAARSHLLGGDFARARELDELVATTGSPRHRLLAAVGYEAASWRPGLPGHRAVELLRAALQQVEHDPADPVYVRALASLGRGLAFTGATEPAGILGRRAIVLARALGEDGLLAHALQASLWNGLHPQDAPGKLERAGELSALAHRTRDLGHLGPAAYYRGVISYLQGQPEELAAAYDDLVLTAHATGQAFFDYMAGCVAYGRHFVSGDLVAADRTCAALLELGESFGTDGTEGPYGVQSFMVRRERGGLEPVRALITGAEDPADHWAPGLLALYTELELAEPARRLLHELLDEGLPRHRDSAQWPSVLVFLVEAALWLEDVPAARRLRPLMGDYTGLNLVAGQFVALFGCADRYLGELDALLGEGTPEAWFASALEVDTRTGATLHQAETLARQAVHRLRSGADRRLVEEPAARARALAEPHGLTRVLRRLEEAPGRREPTAPGRVGAALFGCGLTAREVEVLALLAEGLLNREIAGRLVISESTAANHVRSILAKTGSGNRTQAAMYAAAQGLLVGR